MMLTVSEHAPTAVRSSGRRGTTALVYLYGRIRPRLERCGLERTPLVKAEVHAALSPNSAGTKRAYEGFLISLRAGR